MGPLSYADSDGTAIAYQVMGDTGPWLVMVHGLGYGRLGWGPMVSQLATRRRIVLIDNRGIGASDRPPGPYDARQMAADVKAVLDHLELEQADMVGASLGGMVALSFAARWPSRVRRLVLLATTPGEPQGTPLPPKTSALLAGRVRRRADTPRRLIEGALAPSVPGERPELVEALLQLRAEQAQHPDGWQAQAAASAGFRLGTHLADIDVDTLAMAGTDDAVIDPANTLRLAFSMPRARAVFMAPGGHLFFWEQPAFVAGTIGTFLDAADVDAGPDGPGVVEVSAP